MIKTKVMISEPYYCNEGNYTHFNKLYDMLKEDSDFFTVDKTVVGQLGGIVEIYFHFSLLNENGDKQTIYLSAHSSLNTERNDYWFCNGSFDSDKAYNEQPNGENYRDSDDNLHTYPIRLYLETSYLLSYGGISEDWFLSNPSTRIELVYGENLFYFKMYPNYYYYRDVGAYYPNYNTSFFVTTTNPLGSLPAGVFWGGGKDRKYSLKLDDKWYTNTEIDNQLYQKRMVLFKKSLGTDGAYDYNLTNFTGVSPIILKSRVDFDNNRLWSMAGSTNLSFNNKYGMERNRNKIETIHNSLTFFGEKQYVETEISLADNWDTYGMMIINELDGVVKYV